MARACCIVGNISRLKSPAFSPPWAFISKCLDVSESLSWLWFSYHHTQRLQKFIFTATPLFLQPSPAPRDPGNVNHLWEEHAFHQANEHPMPPEDQGKPLLLKKREIREDIVHGALCSAYVLTRLVLKIKTVWNKLSLYFIRGEGSFPDAASFSNSILRWLHPQATQLKPTGNGFTLEW